MTSRGLRGRAAIAALIALVGALLVCVPSAAAAPVRPTPAAWTPQILTKKGNVRELVPCGKRMYAVGRFTSVRQGGKTYRRRNAFSFNATTGALTRWNPRVRGLVNSIALGPKCGIAYLGGSFSHVHGAPVHNLASVGTGAGLLRPSFAHSAAGEVQTLAMVRNGKHLLVGGAFTAINGTARAYFASLNPRTGAVDGYLHQRVTGRLSASDGSFPGRSQVYNQQVSPDGTRLLIEGDFTHVGGRLHLQLAELDLRPRKAVVDKWHNYQLNHTACANDMVFYGRSATFSPDQKTIYLAATGFEGSSPFCDGVTAFTNTATATVDWINKTGGDSLYSVAASETDVYIGGHERWANNPDGENSCGPGCVPRPGIGDISAHSGKATPWNPTRDRGHGADDLVLTSAGLWVASDTYLKSSRCAGKYHPGICFFPGRG